MFENLTIEALIEAGFDPCEEPKDVPKPHKKACWDALRDGWALMFLGESTGENTVPYWSDFWPREQWCEYLDKDQSLWDHPLDILLQDAPIIKEKPYCQAQWDEKRKAWKAFGKWYIPSFDEEKPWILHDGLKNAIVAGRYASAGPEKESALE